MATFFLMQLATPFVLQLANWPEEKDPTFPWSEGTVDAKTKAVLGMIEDGGYEIVAEIEAPQGVSLEDAAGSLYMAVQPNAPVPEGYSVRDLVTPRVSAGPGDIFMDEDGNLAIVASHGFVFAQNPVKEPAPGM